MNTYKFLVRDSDGDIWDEYTEENIAIEAAKNAAIENGEDYSVYKLIGTAKAPKTIEFVRA